MHVKSHQLIYFLHEDQFGYLCKVSSDFETSCQVMKIDPDTIGTAIEDNTVEGGELGRWCELGQNFSDSSPLLLLVKGHWCAILRKCRAL